ncbi:D-aminoacyl-tRNA deacylase [Alkaliflexus imshenetskii]|jgi:D-aminoacyl-tRNA deacylase|uniref:D-aminoacyl-tRNA deacylase n=1 Tax=Alkaliflexus imshenetskii TaxID=286730 RepID=UPI000479AFAD|nr:D-aminoacyl-tRNA deacylase [Alkaliflexus imshenetskii]
MRVVIQRVTKAKVTTSSGHESHIERGLMILVGIEHRDNETDADWLANKIVALRIFDDENGVMNKSVMDVDGGLMVISQFTLHARTKKGNRPSYIEAAQPNVSVPLYNLFVKKLETITNKTVATGVFGDYMQISLVNDGPVTIVMDSQNRE